jgi:glycosyltransferase involved in cell wall biosynthesis
VGAVTAAPGLQKAPKASRRNLRTVFLSDLEHLGGAGIAASRLARGLVEQGVEVVSLFNNSDSLRVPSGEAVTWPSQHVGVPRHLAIAINAARRFSPYLARCAGHAYSARSLQATLRAHEFDVLHVHAIHNSYWDHATLGALDPWLPVVWTFHDYWPFSPESYRLIREDGTELRIKPDGNDRSKAMARRVAYFKSRRRCRLVANSRDSARRAEELLDLPVEVIAYGIPLDVYSPIDKSTARAALRLPKDAFVVGFIADTRADPVKGFDILRQALSGLSERNVHALALGRGDAGESTIGGVRVKMLGHVTNPAFLAIAYSAADVFVVPSRAEALGMVGMESVACGTPVIGSDVGGIPDVVKEGVTGWLFPVADATSLGARLSGLARNRALANSLASSCRALACRSWDLVEQARRYQLLYSELVQRDAAQSAVRAHPRTASSSLT